MKFSNDRCWLKADIQRRAVRGLLSARKRTLAEQQLRGMRSAPPARSRNRRMHEMTWLLVQWRRVSSVAGGGEGAGNDVARFDDGGTADTRNFLERRLPPL